MHYQRLCQRTLVGMLQECLPVQLRSREPSCWTALVLDALQGLQRCDSFVQAVRQGTPTTNNILIQEFTGCGQCGEALRE
eukprot:236506-Pelagomonas_calceolata.AAC.1